MEIKIVKRTFEAKKYPKDSEKRIELNRNSITSEYMPSEKFIVLVDGVKYDSYKTRKLAEFSAEQIRKYGK